MSIYTKHMKSKSVESRMLSKYETSFHFFQVKSINEMMYSHDYVKSQVSLAYHDIKILCDDMEYLKRSYAYYNALGERQIFHRIELCGQYYAINRNFTYEYPMMVVTNTKTIFVKRVRRLKKITAEEGSSDDTQQKNSQDNFISFQTSEFLKSLDTSHQEYQNNKEDKDLSYDSSIYDMFGDEFVKDEEIIPISTLKNISQQNLMHLIDHFNDEVEIHQVSHITNTTTKQNIEEKIIQKQQQNPILVKQRTLGNIQNRQDPFISIVPIQDLKFSKSSQRKGIIGTYFDLLQERQLNKLAIGLAFDNPYLDHYNQLYRQKEDIKQSNDHQAYSSHLERDRTQRNNKRKKIREKAEELLKRVRNEEETGKSNETN